MEEPPSDLESLANQPTSSDPIGELQDRDRRERTPQARPLVIVLVVLVFGVSAALGLFLSTRPAPAAAPATLAVEPTTESAHPGIVFYADLSRNHSNLPQVYSPVPPVGGVHAPVWLNCGVYDEPVPNENAVHSLEHGVVWITYQPNLNADAIQKLRALVAGHGFVILSPYPDLPKPVVASAWGVQLPLDTLDEAQLQSFIDTYERGPQNPEPGAPCSGGLGEPLSIPGKLSMRG